MEVYISTNKGVKKGPRKLPSVDCTTVNGWLPCACSVMTTLEEIVVGTEPMNMIPTNSPASIKLGFVAHMLTIANETAEVMRKHCDCTNK